MNKFEIRDYICEYYDIDGLIKKEHNPEIEYESYLGFCFSNDYEPVLTLRDFFTYQNYLEEMEEFPNAI